MFSDAKVIKQGNNYYVQHGDDNGLYVEFSIEAVRNEQKSTDEGRPIFEDVEYITIRIVGDTKTVRKRPVQFKWVGNTPPDTERWPRQYEAFKNQEKFVQDGTPLEQWPMLTRSDVAALKEMKIYTVEQLSELPDNALNWTGARKYKEMATMYLAQAKDGSGISKLKSENDQLRRDMEALQNQMKALVDGGKSGKPKSKKEVNDGADIDPVSSSGL